MTEGESTAFWNSFWPSFWSGTASGAITGLITGIVVGYILLKYQRGVEERSTANSYARELSVILDELRTALSKDDVLSIQSVRNTVPHAASAAGAILKGLPLTLWQESLPVHKKLVGHAIELQRALAQYDARATEADSILQRKIREFNHSRDSISANDSYYHKLAVGRLFGVSTEMLLPWLESSGPEAIQRCDQAWEVISKNDRLSDLAIELQERREVLKGLVRHLLAAIDA